jgi:hypothetical protein
MDLLGTVALRPRASSPRSKVERRTPSGALETAINRTSRASRMASGRASGAGRLGRSLNATVPLLHIAGDRRTPPTRRSTKATPTATYPWSAHARAFTVHISSRRGRYSCAAHEKTILLRVAIRASASTLVSCSFESRTTGRTTNAQLRAAYVSSLVPSAGLPKDGTWCDQRFSTGTLVIEAGFNLSLID